jgi:hypothetical protein
MAACWHKLRRVLQLLLNLLRVCALFFVELRDYTCRTSDFQTRIQLFQVAVQVSMYLKVLQVRPSMHHAPSAPFLALTNDMTCSSRTSLKNQRPRPLETRAPTSVIVVSMLSTSLSTDLSSRTTSKRPSSPTPTPNARSRSTETRKPLGTGTRLKTYSLPQGQPRTRTRTKKQL